MWAAVPSLYESLAKARLEVIDGEVGRGGEGRARGSELMIRMTLWSSTSLTDLAPGRAISVTPQALRPAHIPLKHARPVDDATGDDEPCRCGKRSRGRVKETQNG